MIRIELICADPMNPLYLPQDEVTRSAPAISFRILLLRTSKQLISHHLTLVFRIFEIFVFRTCLPAGRFRIFVNIRN